ncbi:LLM class flavin-dependent oxidoreductase [Paenibacillus sp. SYP-B3998]|uniref:LLM class flavin-dependent oxidoreductase n=1 Tax=Paenibacillus sp. SYP-B3998 TaxID=2678564 RepID=A0A6G3ZSJ7_9BACL|nr:LLM class flavin-dependent oxidoreductase [Paenibacillus sp. SYP-B3998]
MAGKRQIKLSAYLVGTGMHVASWRHPDAQVDSSIDIAYYQRLARLAERGKFDIAFIADSLAINEQSHPNILNRFEPLTLITAIAAATSRIGVVATASTSYIEPFNLARLFMSIDHISGGRAGWNIVTTRDLSGNTARNFNGTEHFEHSYRYQRAEEFIDVVKGLWDSWEDDAFIRNQASGQFYDRSKLHRIDHQGEFFSVQGPLNIARSPQGHPVLVQAGSSESGQQFAARSAEIIFSHKNTIEESKVFYEAFKSKVAANGRTPDDVYILQGISPIIGETAQIAREKATYLDSLIPEETGLSFLTDYLNGYDFSRYTLETRARDIGLQELREVRYEFKRFQAIIAKENPTLRQLYSLLTGSYSDDSFIGTPEHIANNLETWFTERAADGFMLMTPLLPSGLADFVQEVVPLLQERGLFRTEYEGTTLRGHFGLSVPANQFEKGR